jgi:hypothetical protein
MPGRKRGTRIILDRSPSRTRQFGLPGAKTSWGVPGGAYILGVADIDRYVDRFVVPYVKYVAEEMGCRMVTWFNHVNEPLQGNNCSTPPGTDDHVHYVQVLAGIRQARTRPGSPTSATAPDTSFLRTYWLPPHMLEMGADPDPYIEAYCMHHYHSHFDWDRRARTRRDPMSLPSMSN